MPGSGGHSYTAVKMVNIGEFQGEDEKLVFVASLYRKLAIFVLYLNLSCVLFPELPTSVKFD